MMRLNPAYLLALPLLLASCQTTGQDTIAHLRNSRVDIKEEKIENTSGKTIDAYRRFLEQTPDSPQKAEATRRLADLEVEKEYGLLTDDNAAGDKENRAPAATAAATAPAEAADALERPGAREAIELYQKLLREYPTYERNDQVLYQMSRAYEEQGQVTEAMQVMARLAREYPRSQYFDEVQFRRAEYFFEHRRYAEAGETYGTVVDRGYTSFYYQLALYKMGWALYKQEQYDKALEQFISLLDYKVSRGYDFAQTSDETERKRMDDTFRALSLSFSNLGGPGYVAEYFTRNGGPRSYEDLVCSNLAEFYFDKRRFGDAAASYGIFMSRNPFHARSPQFQTRVIEIHRAGGFPSLVIDAKKEFAEKYGVQAEYWQHFEPAARPEVLAWLKTNLLDLATHYHARYQSPNQSAGKKANFEEAVHWYREYLASFPKDPDSPPVNYRLADLFLENRSFDQAAVEYERTSYEYRRHEKSTQAGYAAIYAWRELLAGAPAGEKDEAMKEVVRSSIRFADAYPEHEKAPIVLGAAADDLYAMQYYWSAATVARKLTDQFPGAEAGLMCQVLLVAGHANYEIGRYSESEAAYRKLLELLPTGDKSRDARIDNLAAAIYKQGEEANAGKDYEAAAQHFLRVGRLAPTSKIRANADYDAATALIQIKDWKQAAAVLAGFRSLFPGHALQPDVTRKIAYVYRGDGQFSLAAEEYERIDRESGDEDVQREALLTAAELHEKAGDQEHMLAVYRRYVDRFPNPVETNVAAREKMAEVLKKKNDRDGYLAELGQIVALDATAGSGRTAQTRSRAAKAGLVLAQASFDEFVKVKLVEPVEANLDRKKELMKGATRQFNQLIDYEIGDVTAAATFYLAEIYADFSRDLKESERPAGLSAPEREEYDLAIEEQAYPFEEKAIAMHKSNLELISRGVYDEWIDRSLQKLAELVPARYDKPEEESAVIASPDGYLFAIEDSKPAMHKAREGATEQTEEVFRDARRIGSAAR